jgi:hypothetical protein
MKGYLKGTVVVQAGPNRERKQKPSSRFLVVQGDVIEKIDL